MGSYNVIFSPEAEAQLLAIYRWIAERATPSAAERFTGAIVDYCENLRSFPERGTCRDDLRPGLRTIGFRRRVTIAFAVEAEVVTIVGVFYGGQDFEASLSIADE
ncbi:toxin ParE1/3/4 [Methylosinus sp. sav-2]|jgi:toxin ParE1/3/4|uniref:type II toxin-antitoxin system RelE/ParE family toxin n=1 Tax=Methylosinus sp. sav-2 TaxID=2485168 RepID=UPI00047A98EF|nr:type II toxin-antitoxin system RelE/ParE family toxin [Methylosinus sp. sav-2]TDX60789.1 toxin ParE1/3/4 [Methylosinus sp. sav-2]